MSIYEDAFFMNESLAVHSYPYTFFEMVPYYKTYETLMKSSVEHNEQNPCKNKKNKEKENSKRRSEVLSSYGDGIAFAIQSKLYVLKLNFSRKLKCFKRFLNNVSPIPSSEVQRSKRENFSWKPCSKEGSSYWTSRLDPASSKKSLGVQQEEILTRLEQVLQSKRNLAKITSQPVAHAKLFNMELHHEQFYASSKISQFSSSISSFACRDESEGYRKSGMLKQQISSKRRTKLDLTQSASELVTGVRQACSEQKKQCAVCYVNPPNIVTLPCEHHEICSDCFIEIIYMAVKNSRYPLKCVICRQRVEKIRCSRRILLNFIQKNRI